MRYRLTSLQIELTNRCNERCLHCYIPHEHKAKDLDTAFVYDILDQCREMGVLRITLSGGEPMLHKNFLDILRKADECNFSITLFSNLTLLNDEIITELRTKHIREVQASLYSVDPVVHDTITQMPGSCETTKMAIRKLIGHNIPVFISSPIMKQNKDSYADILKWTKNLNIRSAPDNMIMACSNRNSDNLKNRLDPDEAVMVIQDILKYDNAYDNKRFDPGYKNTGHTLPCVQDICAASLSIAANADVRPVPAWDYVLGNLQKQSLRDIWENSAEIKRIRNIGLKDFPKCQTCPNIQFCGMSLEGNANENTEGDPFMISEVFCETAAMTRKVVFEWKKNRSNYAV